MCNFVMIQSSCCFPSPTLSFSADTKPGVCQGEVVPASDRGPLQQAANTLPEDSQSHNRVGW